MNDLLLTTPLLKALTTGNSQNVQFADPSVRGDEPTDDGVYKTGLGGTGPQQILVIPYAEALPGATWRMRVMGWWHHGALTDVQNVIWVPMLLAEFYCTAGNKTGLASRLVREGEVFAGNLVLTAGTLGTFGLLSSGGSISFAKLDTQGCHKIQFDFDPGQDYQPPLYPNGLTPASLVNAPSVAGSIPMALGNCLWAKTSSG